LGWNGPADRSGKVGVTEHAHSSAIDVMTTRMARRRALAGSGTEVRTMGQGKCSPVCRW
jgi:hypothetical protein